jgi:predicted RNA-binding Zn ribbon-like protein
MAMAHETPENRLPAPGALQVVQEFMNSAHLGGGAAISPEIAEAIRLRHAAGDSQTLLASQYGIGRGFVAALARGARPGDDLASAEAAGTWLTNRGLLPNGSAVGVDGLERLRELRELLRALAQANNGERIDRGVLPSLDRIAARVPLAIRFGTLGGPALGPVADGVDGAIGRLLVIVHEAMRNGSFQRLKRCPGEGCPHTFYDASRNRTGTWCAMSVCGNRTKVRSYQSRRRAAKTGATSE